MRPRSRETILFGATVGLASIFGSLACAEEQPASVPAVHCNAEAVVQFLPEGKEVDFTLLYPGQTGDARLSIVRKGLTAVIGRQFTPRNPATQPGQGVGLIPPASAQKVIIRPDNPNNPNPDINATTEAFENSQWTIRFTHDSSTDAVTVLGDCP